MNHVNPPELPKPVRDMIGEVVLATQTAILATLQAANPRIERILFLCAPDDEIIETLDAMGQTQAGQYQKAVMIMLFEDITVSQGDGSGYFSTNLNLLIATLTQPTYKSSQRETASFEPVLRPIKREFFKQLYQSPYFAVEGQEFPCDTTDRKRWGRQKLIGSDGKRMGDHIDAIEIANLELKLWPAPVAVPFRSF